MGGEVVYMSKRLKGGLFNSTPSKSGAIKLCWESGLCEPRGKILDTLLSDQGMGLLFYRKMRIWARVTRANILPSIKEEL